LTEVLLIRNQTYRKPRLTQPDRKKAVILFEDIATAHLARGSVNEASRIAQQGLAVLRETEFAMWLPKFGALAQGLNRWQRQPQVRSYLEEFAMTKRQFAPVFALTQPKIVGTPERGNSRVAKLPAERRRNVRCH
jgi:hypothetical protein